MSLADSKHPDAEMTCKEVAEVAPLYVGDDLTREEQRTIQHHLLTCDACQTLVEEQRQSHSWLSSARGTLAPVDEARYRELRRVVGRRIDEDNPTLDARLPDGSRVAAVPTMSAFE